MRSLFIGLGGLVNVCLGLFCLALGLLGWIDGGDMHVRVLPVTPASTAAWLVGTGVFAILAAALALRAGRWSRIPLLVWSLALVAVLVQAVFSGSYRFDGMEAFVEHGLMTLVSLILFCASWLGYRAAANPPSMSHASTKRFRRSR